MIGSEDASEAPDPVSEILEAVLAAAPAARDDALDAAVAAHPELEGAIRGRFEALRRLGFLEEDGGEADGGPVPRRLGPFHIRSLLAAGGMGQVFVAWQEGLERDVALKVLRPELQLSPAARRRFLREALAVGRLSHPGIVPVHHLGEDAAGRAFLAMLLVEGRTADRAFDDARLGRDGWSTTRALEVMLRVCDALAYAHERGVVHRDLKPDNVMVGAFGEVYVMDWGLAQVSGQPDDRDIRVAEPRAGSDSPLFTLDGSVIGTPCYMPPEQARGEIDRVGPRADVYAAGAMLYRLLAGHPPYCDSGRTPAPGAVLDAVREGPPTPVDAIAPSVPPALAAIQRRAMARDPDERYPKMADLAADLRAFLEDRVVRAHRTGAIAELRMWIRRNRGLAAGLLATLVVSVVGAITTSVFAIDAARAVEEFELVSYVVRLEDAREVEASLHPPWPEVTTRMEEWLADHAAALRDGLPRLERALRRLRTRGEPAPDQSPLPNAKALAARVLELEASATDDREAVADAAERHGAVARRRAERAAARLRELALARAQLAAGAGWRLRAPAEQFLHDTLSRLVAELIAFTGPGGTAEQVEERAEWSRGIVAKSIDAHLDAWARARDAVAADPRFDGFELAPQVGLVPLGPDRRSGLQEFAHLRSGPPAVREAAGALRYEDETGIVFVLVPGGTATIGAQSADPDAARYDPQATDREGPVHTVELAPFFLGKHELTQAQWQALTYGETPASYGVGQRLGPILVTGRHPVETVTWAQCDGVLRRAGLVLPTEAQWEHACRAGSDTPFWTGEDRESLREPELAANLADRSAASSGARWSSLDDWPDFNDGQPIHARVGRFRANPFGLHDVHGNVFEWCRDGYGSYELPARPGDGYRQVPDAPTRVCRGGAFSMSARDARASWRDTIAPDIKLDLLGVRPARPVL